MAHLHKIAVWNANGLCQHAQEIKLFLQTLLLDILPVSETDFVRGMLGAFIGQDPLRQRRGN